MLQLTVIWKFQVLKTGTVSCSDSVCVISSVFQADAKIMLKNELQQDLCVK
jgi:hypothetical protein